MSPFFNSPGEHYMSAHKRDINVSRKDPSDKLPMCAWLSMKIEEETAVSGKFLHPMTSGSKDLLSKLIGFFLILKVAWNLLAARKEGEMACSKFSPCSRRVLYNLAKDD